MPKRESIIPDEMRNVHDRFHYSPGVKVGNTLYMAGQLGRDENLNVIPDPEAQIAQAFENVGKILKAAGGAFADIVDMEVWFTNWSEDFQTFLEVKDRYISSPYPTLSAFECKALSMSARVEIKCVAVLDD